MAIRGFTGWLGVVLGAPDPPALARFYSELLGWEISSEEPDWVTVLIPGTTSNLAFQLEEDHVPPTWPPESGDQQMQVHLDIGVRDVPAAVEDALALGARLASYQPQDDVRVMIDPAGHPFCLYLDAD